MATVRVNGNWIELTIGTVGDLEWSNRWPKGPWEASWRMDLPGNYHHPDLIVDALVEIMVGPAIVWGGVLRRPIFDGDSWEFVAEGYARLAERFLCLAADEATSTTTPDTALTEAVARGLRWTLPSSIGGASPVAATDETDGVNYLDVLLDAWCEQQGNRWRITPAGLFATEADPTEPTLTARPGVGVLSVSDDATGSRLFGRYKSASTTFATVDVVATTDQAYREEAVNLTDLGVITSGVATDHLDGLIAAGNFGASWANGLELTANELTTAGGVPASLPHVGTTPEVIRLHGVLNPITRTLTYLDFILGETTYRNGGGTIQLTPLGVAQGTTLRSAVANG